MSLDVVGRFGALVRKLVEEGKPGQARQILCIGFGAMRQTQQHLPSNHLLPARAQEAVYAMDSVRNPLAHPERAAIVNVFLPCEPLHAMGISPQVAEGLSCYMTGSKAQQPFLEAATKAGAPETLCSYHRILTGMALSDTLPRPRFIANTTMLCDANELTFRLLAQHYDVPHLTVDVPSDPTTDGAIDYVTRQLHDLVDLIEETMGEKFDEEALRTSVDRSRKTLRAYSRYLDLLSRRTMRNDPTSEMYTVLMLHVLLGSLEAEAFCEQLAADALASPTLDVDGDGHLFAKHSEQARPRRILWAHVLPYYQQPVRAWFSEGWGPGTEIDLTDGARRTNQLLCTDMTFDSLPVMDPQHPYESMARRLVENCWNGTADRRCTTLIDQARHLHADGIVYFCHWGCRGTSGLAPIVTDLAAQADIPLLILDGDGCDPGNTSDGQVRTRLEAFAELIDAHGSLLKFDQGRREEENR
jgi:benzoyl-CoA reductase/2-hydroxyglutaryl-CoA dehydratase subunit BcrC/BadD/HgdB